MSPNVVTKRSQQNAEVHHTTVARERSVGELIRGALCADISRLVAHDAAARLGEDAEGVHQARVATRRLRSNLRTFDPVLRSSPTVGPIKDLRWLGRALGVVRDLDVLRDRIAKDLQSLDPLARGDGMVLIESIDLDRGVAADELASTLGSKRYRSLLAALVVMAAAPPFRRSAGLPAEDFFSAAIHDRFVALVAAIDALPAVPQDDELHAVRILAKPTRYAAELGVGVLGAPCSRFARRVTDLCDALGSLNDGAKANQWLDHVTIAPWRAFAVGRVRAAEIGRMVEARAAWARSWDRTLAAAAEMDLTARVPSVPV
jgi:CHAD domain-containing protein